MGDKKTLKALGEAFCKEVKNKIGDKYKNINTMMKTLMTHINRNKDSTTVIETVNSIEKELRIKGEHIPKISESAKNLRAFWDVDNQVGITGRGLDKKDGSSPNTTNLEDQSSEVKLIAKAAEGLGTTEANKQEDISRLKTENHYLREALEGLHQGIHGGDETALTKSRKPQETKNNPTCKELEVKIKDIADKFHGTKTELDDTYSKINSLFTKMDVIEKEAILSPNVINKIVAHGGTAKNNVLQKPEQPQRSLQLKEDLQAVESAWADMKGKKGEAEYTFRLLEELNKYSGYEGTQGTAVSLPEPPTQHERGISKEGKNVVKQKHEKPRSEHDEQLLKSFNTAYSVFEKLSEAEYAARLLKELDKYSGYEGTPINLPEPPIQKARDSSKEGNTGLKKQGVEKPGSEHDKQQQNNLKTASSVLQKMINATSAQEERDCLLLSLEHLSHVQDLSDGNTEVNITTALDRIQSSVKKDSSVYQGLIYAKDIFLVHMNVRRNATSAQEERDCLLLSLEHLSHVQDPSDGSTEVNISTALDQTQSSVKRESSINKGLIYAKEILVEYTDVIREADYATCLLQELNTYAGYDGKHDTPIRLTNPPIQTNPRSRHNEQLQQNFKCASNLLKKLRIQNEMAGKAKQVEETTVKLQKIQHENDTIKKEADSLRTRLSEHVGLAVTHENPAITDLSDPNRPTKLGEKYSELYDNQWTDAFEIISKLYEGTSDKIIAEYLYEMLVDCYGFCKEAREKQKQALEDIMLYPLGGTQSSQRTQKDEDFNKLFAKALTDAAKMSGNVTGANLAKIFLRSEELKEKDKEWTKVCETYLECCVQICWLMQVQTPPVCIDLKTKSGQRFDKNVYREYTKIGKKVAFVVWPALLLHEKGPTLCKGVAQGQ